MIDWNKRNGGFLSPESVYEDQLGNLSQQINEKDKEIERLNNIIDELEKYISKNLNDIYGYFENTPFGVENTYKEVLNKLQELKGE